MTDSPSKNEAAGNGVGATTPPTHNNNRSRNKAAGRAKSTSPHPHHRHGSGGLSSGGSNHSGGSGNGGNNRSRQQQKGRRGGKSKSPPHRQHHQNHNHHHRYAKSESPHTSVHHRHHYSSDGYHHHHPSNKPAAEMSVLVHRVYLCDSGSNGVNQYTEEGGLPPACAATADPYHHFDNHVHHAPQQFLEHVPHPPVNAYHFEDQHHEDCGEDANNSDKKKSKKNKKKAFPSTSSVAVCRVPQEAHPSPVADAVYAPAQAALDKTACPNPYGNPAIEKYWKQRHRLFSRFDQGILLDEEGWFSVTPEQIADHTAHRVCEFARTAKQSSADNNSSSTSNEPIVILDAFCGCGGNMLAFAKHSDAIVYAVDIDRTKLQKAAHNARIYQIPPERIVFIECNVLFLLEYCFRDGHYILDQPIASPEHATRLMACMPPPVPTEICNGYSIGGIDMLPRTIDVVFMDPPWGGADYTVFGKNGYDLKRNMRIMRPVVNASAAACQEHVQDDFFDTFATAPHQQLSKKERKSQFNIGLDEENCINGAELVALAAAATRHRLVVYDVPRNTNRVSLGQAALFAGYRGNIKLEEHFLNGRLKTVTAYFGTDWSRLLLCNDDHDNHTSHHHGSDGAQDNDEEAHLERYG